VSSPVRSISVKAPRSSKTAFNVKLFLDSAGLGKKIAKFRTKETVFARGDPAKNVTYIQEGSVKLTVVNETGKVDQLCNSSEKRLARTLLLLAHYGERVIQLLPIGKCRLNTRGEADKTGQLSSGK
jgi:hypothetical protein